MCACSWQAEPLRHTRVISPAVYNTVWSDNKEDKSLAQSFRLQNSPRHLKQVIKATALPHSHNMLKGTHTFWHFGLEWFKGSAGSHVFHPIHMKSFFFSPAGSELHQNQDNMPRDWRYKVPSHSIQALVEPLLFCSKDMIPDWLLSQLVPAKCVKKDT